MSRTGRAYPTVGTKKKKFMGKKIPRKRKRIFCRVIKIVTLGYVVVL